jgi:RNA polymerase sigma-70 factor (ECF subfamily)
MNESNALLAQQFRQNDQTAFSKLVGRHQSLVFRVCLRILRHRQDAEDATQETFSRVARYLDRWDSRRPLEPWLVAIAGNRCRTLLASKRSFQSLTSSTEPATSEGLSQREAECLREELQLALMRIPESHRRAFHLFHEESLSYAEIADVLNCPLGTVKTWVHRARASIIDELRDRDVVSHFDASDRDAHQDGGRL